LSCLFSPFAALGFGAFTIGMSFVAQFLGDFVLQMAFSIFGFVGGPLNGLLSLGLFFPFVNSWVSFRKFSERRLIIYQTARGKPIVASLANTASSSLSSLLGTQTST
jgi:signal transduction histidine kinase